MGRDRVSSGMSTGGYSSCKYALCSDELCDSSSSLYLIVFFVSIAADAQNFSACETARNI
jgi:hypothetical protein